MTAILPRVESVLARDDIPVVVANTCLMRTAARRWRLACASLAIVSLAGCAQAQSGARAARAAPAASAAVQRAGEPPSVPLTADILYRVLVAELSAHDGDFATSGRTLLGLARDTADARLAQRAFQVAMAARDASAALQAARLWVRQAPEDSDARAAMLALSASSGEVDGLVDALRDRVANADNLDQAIIQAAAIAGRLSDKQAALDVLVQALEPWVGRSAMAHLALADMAADAGDMSRAFEEVRTALTLDKASEMAMQRLLEYGWDDARDDVLATVSAYVDANPASRKLQLMLVNRLLLAGDSAAAVARIEHMREAAPEDFDLLYYEAQVRLQAGQLQPARALLDEYIHVQTQRRQSVRDEASNAEAGVSDARLLLVRIAEQENRLDEAIAELDRIVERPLQFQAQVHKAVLLGRMGRMADAQGVLDGLVGQDDHERSVIALTRASILREAGRTDQAVATLEGALRAMPDAPALQYDLAMLYERQGRLPDFERLMRRIIELDPDHANALNALGYTLADQNRELEEAGELLERALELAPDSPYIQDSVGWYLYRTGDLDGALPYLRQSYDSLPSAEVAAHLGEVLWKLGRRDEARRIWAAGRTHEADNATLLETLQRLGVTLGSP